MTHTKLHPTVFVLLFLCFSVCSSCAEKKRPREEVKKEIAHSDSKVFSDCDPKLWKNVYNPRRLKVLNECITITGVIKKSDANEDGDQHMLLQLDGGQENLLKKKNKKYLVIEAVCINKITERKVGKACKGYVNNVTLPNIGDHVKVTGSYVIDTHNGWAEIHPVTSITVMK